MKFELRIFKFLKIMEQTLLSINNDNDIRIIFFNKSKLGKFIPSFCRFRASKIQIIKLTITEDKIIPTTPKLYGERFPKLLIGAPIKIQSKKMFNIIPANDNLNGKFAFSIE